MVEANDLRGKKFHVIADVGPQYESQREQTVEDLKGMIDAFKEQPAAQQYMPLLFGVLLENIEGVGLEPIKDFNRRNMILQGLIKPDTDEEKQMLAQAQQQQQNQQDPQAKLIESVTAQQEAEARNLDASSLQKGADANLKEAQTIKTIAEIGLNRDKLLAEIRDKTFQNIKRLPI